MTNEPVLSEWNEQRRLAGRNFQCQRCDQRWNEDDLRRQDGFYLCVENCYEENGGEIDRQLERAKGSELAAALEPREQRPPKESGWYDDDSIVAISDLSPRKVTVIRSGASQTMVLTGVGFLSTHTLSSDASITVTPSFDSDTQITLTISAAGGATVGIHSITYTYTFGSQTLTDIYPNSIDVR